MPHTSLIAAVDRFKKEVQLAGDRKVVIAGDDAALIRDFICSVKSAQCMLQDTGDICSCALLDVKCPNRY